MGHVSQQRKARRKLGNYVHAIASEVEGGRIPPGVHVMNVFHDKWCALLNGKGLCDCAPDVKLAPKE